jgi:hypothetical protein
MIPPSPSIVPSSCTKHQLEQWLQAYEDQGLWRQEAWDNALVKVETALSIGDYK